MSSSESSSDSSSESEVEQKKSRKSPSSEEDVRKIVQVTGSQSVDSHQSSSSSPEPTPKVTKKPKFKSTRTTTQDDAPMRDISSSPAPVPAQTAAKPQSKVDEDFDAIYIRKITTELADDLDKVRSAQDFKANSIPILIHALKQGESLFSGEEKRRVVGTAKA